ncbi:sugar phosphate nucleotidyltransferase [Prochlorococcus sp. MIT 1300]|uniref:sugar phosphate nucleotidyltransferase n=1 Tax=Prochlorococcus sp. MIT 1300 TaxID=3096218 RepID=UPI002A760316|nr:sugar phosphate nucleotidyltransferase [Prochlorococcus sp. MIT 1300]
MNIQRDVIILCGGLGTRLNSISFGKQKCILQVDGKPFLTHILDWLADQNLFKRVFLATGHGSSEIIDIFEYSYKGITLIYCKEDEPLGTGGAVLNLVNKYPLTQKFYLVNGDTFSPFQIQLLEQPFKNKGCSAVLHSVVVEDARRYGSLEISTLGKIQKFKEKSVQATQTITTINAGTYLFDQSIFKEYCEIKSTSKFSLESNILSQLAADDKLYTVTTNSEFIDIGIPEDYERSHGFISNYLQKS